MIIWSAGRDLWRGFSLSEKIHEFIFMLFTNTLFSSVSCDDKHSLNRPVCRQLTADHDYFVFNVFFVNV